MQEKNQCVQHKAKVFIVVLIGHTQRWSEKTATIERMLAFSSLTYLCTAGQLRCEVGVNVILSVLES